MAILKDLIVHGSSRFLNKIYASEIQTPLIEAEAGIFKKLKADDATVVGLLDVKGQLHTNSWSNSNIATIDGSFYITPTIGSASGTVTITASSLVFSGTNYAVSSLYLGDGSSITWPQYSKVLVTGQILSNGEWIPLGTLLGQLSSTATAASISINSIKDNKNQTSNVLATLVSNGTTSSNYRNLKVSLYQRASSSTAFYPIGIYMTATGTNGRTFLDIYGGVETLSNSNNYGGFAEPNVRIGNLNGLPNVGGQAPSGWGIYTDNGYFKGIIAADKGYIGSGSRYWVIANYEDGSNPSNSRSYIYNNTDSMSSTEEGIYLGTDGIRNYKDSTHFVTIQNGVINAKGVNLTGIINATEGNIGGATIENGVLKIANINITGTINGNHIDASSIDIEDLNGAGNYALKTEVTDAEKVATSYITYIDSTEGIKIHNISDQTNYLKLNSSAISMYRNNVETLNINNNEVRIGKNSGNNVYIDSDSIDIKNGQTILATFGEAMQIGQNNKNHATINPLSFKLIDKEGNTYFYVSDLREDQDGTVEIIDTFVSDGSNPAHSTDDGGYVSTLKTYYLSFTAFDTNYTVEVSDSSGEGLTKTRDSISFTRNANEGAIITVTYKTSSYLVKAYTLGFRLENSKIGALSCGIGDHITASGISSYAEGYKTIASARTAHAEGWCAIASGSSSHAEGTYTTASGSSSHAEGWTTIASGLYSHTEGRETTASGSYSHAEGQGSVASGDISHAEGQNSVASGWLSHAEGAGTIASSSYQHVQGKYNIEDPNNRYAFIIGNGRHEPNTIVRSNALTVDWNGNIEVAGDITANNLSINKIITGNYNIEDTNNQYAFIVGNGIEEDGTVTRSNALTIDWDGNTEIAGDLTVTGKLIADRFGGSYLPAGTNIDNLTKDDSGWWAYLRSDVSGTFILNDTAGMIGHIQGTSDQAAMQILRSDTQGANNRTFFVRFKLNGTWGSWQHITSSTITPMTINLTQNNYCTYNDVTSMYAYRKGGWLWLRGNLHVTYNVPVGTTAQIGTITGWFAPVSVFQNVVERSNKSALVITLSYDGKLSITNNSVAASAGYYNFNLIASSTDGQ